MINSSAMVFNIDALVGPTERNNDERKRFKWRGRTNRVFQQDNRVKLMYYVHDVNQYHNY